MGLNVDDCPPSLRAAIFAALSKEAAEKPVTVTDYAIQTMVNGEPHFSAYSTDKKRVMKLVKFFNLRNGEAAHRSIIGQPLALLVVRTTTTQPKADNEAY